jgi:hypothetical protein
LLPSGNLTNGGGRKGVMKTNQQSEPRLVIVRYFHGEPASGDAAPVANYSGS